MVLAQLGAELDRVIETGIGAAVAIVILFVSRRVVNREKPAAAA